MFRVSYTFTRHLPTLLLPGILQMWCPICLETLVSESESSQVVCTPCGHIFHGECLTAALPLAEIGDHKCPVCRTPLEAGVDRASLDSTDTFQIPSYPAIRRIYLPATGTASEPTAAEPPEPPACQHVHTRTSSEAEQQLCRLQGTLARIEERMASLESWHQLEIGRLNSELTNARERLEGSESQRRRMESRVWVLENLLSRQKSTVLSRFCGRKNWWAKPRFLVKTTERRSSFGVLGSETAERWSPPRIIRSELTESISSFPAIE